MLNNSCCKLVFSFYSAVECLGSLISRWAQPDSFPVGLLSCREYSAISTIHGWASNRIESFHASLCLLVFFVIFFCYFFFHLFLVYWKICYHWDHFIIPFVILWAQTNCVIAVDIWSYVVFFFLGLRFSDFIVLAPLE